MVKCSVFFAVRTELLNIIQTSLCFKGLDHNSYERKVNKDRKYNEENAASAKQIESYHGNIGTGEGSLHKNQHGPIL
jgi:hypothetical protein